MTDDGKPMEGLTKTGCSTCGTSCPAPAPDSKKKEKLGRVMSLLYQHRRLLCVQEREFERKPDQVSRLKEIQTCLVEIDQVIGMLDEMETIRLTKDGKHTLQAMVMALNIAIYAGTPNSKLTSLVDHLRRIVIVEDCQSLTQQETNETKEVK
jgi:hypothetical protein